jgi:hypothetical protein
MLSPKEQELLNAVTQCRNWSEHLCGLFGNNNSYTFRLIKHQNYFLFETLIWTPSANVKIEVKGSTVAACLARTARYSHFIEHNLKHYYMKTQEPYNPFEADPL